MKISKRIKTLFINEHFEKFFKEINKSAEKITFKQIGKNVMIYPCGFAWIYFEKKSENEPFVQWLIREQKNGIYKCPLQKKYIQYCHGNYNQSMLHKQTHCQLIAEVLNDLGISCSAGARID